MEDWMHLKAILACAVAVGLMVLVTACGSSGSSSSSSSTSASTEPSANKTEESGAASSGSADLKEAEKQVEEGYAGRYTEPPSEPNPAATEKTIWFISPGQASPNSLEAYEAAKEASEASGWNMQLYDSKLEPANFSIGIKQAVAAGADGIIAAGIDCSLVKGPLEEAKKAGIPAVAIQALNCNETDPGEKPLYTNISLGNRYKNFVQAFEQSGSDMAAWGIVQHTGKANVLNFTNTEYTIISDNGKGFEQRLESCSECKVTNVPWSLSEFGSEATNKVKSALVKEPEANVLFDSLNATAGLSNGVVQAGKTEDVQVVGGLGIAEEFQMIKENKGLNAMAVWPDQWWSWAAVDTLNSVMNGNPVEDSGLGTQIVDAEHNLPKGEHFEPSVDFQALYKKRWGV
jgi:ribose transport system substrate-binding protein